MSEEQKGLVALVTAIVQGNPGITEEGAVRATTGVLDTIHEIFVLQKELTEEEYQAYRRDHIRQIFGDLPQKEEQRLAEVQARTIAEFDRTGEDPGEDFIAELAEQVKPEKEPSDD